MTFWNGAKMGAKYTSLAAACIFGTLGMAGGPMSMVTGAIGGLLGGAFVGGLIGGIAVAVLEDKKPKPIVLEAPPVVVHTPVLQQSVTPGISEQRQTERTDGKTFTQTVDDSRAKTTAAGVGGPG